MFCPDYIRNCQGVTGRSVLTLAMIILFWQHALPGGTQPTSTDYIPPDVTVPDPVAPNTVPASAAGSAERVGMPGGEVTLPSDGQFFTPTGWPFRGGAGASTPPAASQPISGFSAARPGFPPPGTASSSASPGLPGAAPAHPGTAAGFSATPPGSGLGPQGFAGASSGYPGAPSTQGSPFPGKKDPLAILQTTRGPIAIRLFRKYAPQTVAHFTEIAETGFYNGLAFFRVVPGKSIQTGCPNGNGSGFFTDPVSKQPKFIGIELNSNLKHNAAGVVGLARAGKSALSASSQFYITLSPQPTFDRVFSIFGGVVSGMEVVNQIQPGDRILSIQIQEQP